MRQGREAGDVRDFRDVVAPLPQKLRSAVQLVCAEERIRIIARERLDLVIKLRAAHMHRLRYARRVQLR